jgi:flavin reductase (DIM6/NTAB) family NADH-FMN oxidoreductase RutF
MKIEIGEARPGYFKEYWPLQYEIFSHFEFAAGIPHVLFAIATVKENGKPNICLSSWSAFTGSGGGYFAVLGGVMKRSHTYANILRTGEFTVNFLSKDYYDGLTKTIEHNEPDADEFSEGGFTPEDAASVSAPRIKEAFLSLECTLEKADDLPDGSLPLIIGRVRHLAMQEAYAGSFGAKYGEDGFMFNIHSPADLKTGENNISALSACRIVRTIE